MTNLKEPPHSARVHTRLPASLVVTFRIAGRAAFIERYASNVSKGGIFIVSREVHPIGSEIKFEIRSVDGSTVFTGIGIVRWTKLHDPATKQLPGLGIQFTNLDDENQQVLEKLLALNAESLTETQSGLQSLSTPAASSAQMMSAAAEPGPGAAQAQLAAPASVTSSVWPGTVPGPEATLEMLTYARPAPAALTTSFERFMSGLAPEARAAMTGRWPGEVAKRYRTVLATQVRLVFALDSRPQSADADSAALDALFANADEALATAAELSESIIPEVKTACEWARGSVARLVQELLPTSDARAVATDLETAEATKRLRHDQAAAKAAPVITLTPTAPGKPGLLKRIGLKTAIGLAAVSLGLAAFVVWSSLKPLEVKPLPELPELPAGTVVLGNAASGQMMLQRSDGKPLDNEAIAEFKKRAESRAIRVTAAGPTQLILEPAAP